MTACASFMPIKANAVSVTLTPVGSLKRNSGDSIEFLLTLNPNSLTSPSGNEVILQGFSVFGDLSELYDLKVVDPIASGTPLNTTTTIARLIFNVLQPVKDGNDDVTATVNYRYENVNVTEEAAGPLLDVEPVPEPVTIFGTATALGCGALFRRKFSKKTVS